MKLHYPIARPDLETIASFGTGQLVRKLNGDYRSLGGRRQRPVRGQPLEALGKCERNSAMPKARSGPSERARASQWVSRFMPGAFISIFPAPNPAG